MRPVITTSVTTSVTTLPLILALLCACGGSSGNGSDDTSGSDAGSSDAGSSDAGGSDAGGNDGGAVATEQDCSDGTDNDGDGDADCRDTDCSEDFWCNLPQQIDFSSQFNFTGNTIECEVLGFPIDVDVDNCITSASATLLPMHKGPRCDDCDETFEGLLTYTQDSCSSLLETTFPADALYGFVYNDALNRELWAQDEAGTWTLIEHLTSTDGHIWEILGSEAVWTDPADCNNGKQNVGTLDLSLRWTDR